MSSLLPLPVVIFLLFILALLSFLLSASETSIIGLSRIRLRHMLKQGLKRAQSVQRLIAKLDKFITSILVFNNFVNIAISSIVAAMCVMIFGYKWGIIIATMISASFIVIICEITPKILALKNTERTALLIAPVMEALIRIFSPLTAIFSGASSVIIKLLRIKQAKRSALLTEEELRLMIELGQEEGFVSAGEAKMLQRIFEFGNIKVKDVMVPRDKVTAININASPQELLDIFVEQGHARLPVYKDTADNIVGIIYARDLLYILRDKELFVVADLVRDAYYVPALTPVDVLLKKFQEDKVQIAIIADAHKKALGLVTLEDLIEEIVGELEERHGSTRTKKN